MTLYTNTRFVVIDLSTLAATNISFEKSLFLFLRLLVKQNDDVNHFVVLNWFVVEVVVHIFRVLAHTIILVLIFTRLKPNQFCLIYEISNNVYT